jgi:hypothetical protein
MKTFLVALAVACLAAAGLAAAAIGGSSSAAKGGQTFVDPTGDAVDDAPDVAQVDVSNEDNGDISIVVGTNRSSGFGEDDVVYILLDTDNNPATGSASGFDYLYAAAREFSGLYSWNGNSWTGAPAPTASGSVGNAGQVSLRINRSDLGNTAAFNLAVVTNGSRDSSIDTAPDTGTYHYELVFPPPTTTTTTTTETQPLPPAPPPSPKFLVTTVGKPHAGKRFTVRVEVKLAGASLAPSSLACSASVGRTKAKTAAGRQACVVLVPARTAGKVLAVALRFHYHSVAGSRILRLRIV